MAQATQKAPLREISLGSTRPAVGNGYLGVRGALVDPLPGSSASTFLSGVFAPKVSAYPFSEVELKAAQRARGVFVELATLDPFLSSHTDQLHHEYPATIQALIAHSAPLASPQMLLVRTKEHRKTKLKVGQDFDPTERREAL